MSGELFTGIKDVLQRDGISTPDTVKAGTVSQLSPDRRDAQVDALKHDLVEGKPLYTANGSHEQYRENQKKIYATLARTAATILVANDRTAYWRERPTEYGEDGVTEGSKSRDQVAAELLTVLTSRAAVDVKHQMFGDHFCIQPRGNEHAVNAMKPHERNLFIRIAPQIVEQLQLLPVSQQNEWNRGLGDHIKKQLKILIEGGLPQRMVGKDAYRETTKEAMLSLLEIDSKQGLEALTAYLRDASVDVYSKIEVINNVDIKSLSGTLAFVTALKGLDEAGLKGSKKVLEAGLKKLDGKTSLTFSGHDIVTHRGHDVKRFDAFNQSEQREITASYKAVLRSDLLGMRWDGSTTLAAEAIRLSVNATQTRTKIFDGGWESIDGIRYASTTILEALPKFIKGKHEIRPDDYRLRDNQFGQLLARSGLIRRENVHEAEQDECIKQLFSQVKGLFYAHQEHPHVTTEAMVTAALDSLISLRNSYPRNKRPDIGYYFDDEVKRIAQRRPDFAEKVKQKLIKLGANFIH